MSEDRVWTGDIRREYSRATLDLAELSPDPIAQFRGWFEEGKATVLEPNAMALATSDALGMPSIRMVLMKGFDREGFLFGTSYESRKAREIAANPHASVLFYWPTLERQVRVAGSILKASPADSDAIFMARPRLSRLAAIASHQSAPIGSRAQLEQSLEHETSKAADLEVVRPTTWGGYRLRPQEFEFWQGGRNRLHDRFLYSPDGGGWAISRLQP